jgi:Spy/CpxP family protein refolding chaperone
MKTTISATTIRFAATLVVPAALAVLSACNHAGENATSPAPAIASAPPASAPPAPPASAPTDSAATQAAPAPGANTSSAPPHPEHGRHADPTNALLDAVHDLPLTDSQKATIHALEEQLEANEKETGASFQAMRAELIAQVKAGKIDVAKLRADQAASDKALQVHIAKEADTLNGLHAALDAAQRKTAVAAVRAKQEPEHDKDRMGAGPSQERSAQDWAKKRIDRMTRNLDLDSGQQQKVAALLANQHAPGMSRPQEDRRRERMGALLTAFEKDTFDAKTAVPATPAMATARHEQMERQIAFLSKLLPLLRAEQREKLAASMEGGGMGGHHDDDED